MTFAKWTRPHSADDAETWTESDLAPTLNPWEQRAGGESTPTVLISETWMVGTANGQYGDARELAWALANNSRHQAVSTSSTEDSPVKTSAWPVNGPVFPASAAVCGLSSTVFCPSCGHDGRSLRMFPDCFPQTGAPTSVSYSGGWATSGMGGPTEFWTRATSESPNGAVVCSLSAILETRSVPRRYWLSARAAAGILRRAAKRGKELPLRLQEALQALAAESATDGTPPICRQT